MRLDPYLSRLARPLSRLAQVLESPVDGSWWLVTHPVAPWRCLAIGGEVDPRSPRRRFHEARRELRRLIATSATALPAKTGRGPA